MEWLITFHTYATHFHDAPALAGWERAHARQPPYLLDAPRRAIVLAALRQACQAANWRLLAAHVRTNHVHIVISAQHPPDRIMTHLKARASRALHQARIDPNHRLVWARHGSTRPIRNLPAAISYVLDGQGPKLDFYDPHPATAHEVSPHGPMGRQGA